MKTLRWTLLLALQSNRSAEFFILHSPALIPKFPQSPSGSYLFSHDYYLRNYQKSYQCYIIVAIALKLLPVFTQKIALWETLEDLKEIQKVAIALKLLPVFTQFLFLMQKTCAFLNPKILTSLSNPF